MTKVLTTYNLLDYTNAYIRCVISRKYKGQLNLS